MAILEVNNLKKSFNQTEVLKGIDFQLEKGEVLAIIGSSGSGKTTLLRCLNFLETADEGEFSVNGEVLFDAHETRKVSEKELRKKRLHFGLVFQSFNLFPHYSVLKNVSLAPTLFADEMIANERKSIASQLKENPIDFKTLHGQELEVFKNAEIEMQNQIGELKNEFDNWCIFEKDKIEKLLKEKFEELEISTSQSEKAKKQILKNEKTKLSKEFVFNKKLKLKDLKKQCQKLKSNLPEVTATSFVGEVNRRTKQFQKAHRKENVAMALELLKKVGLSEKSRNYPCELSGGQCQRVAIARALALNPDILCFDEPTSALDPELTGEVLKVIKGLKSNDRTMIIVTHEMEFAKNVADKIMFMADGVIAEFGTPQEVFENPKNPKTQAFLSKSLELFGEEGLEDSTQNFEGVVEMKDNHQTRLFDNHNIDTEKE